MRTRDNQRRNPEALLSCGVNRVSLGVQSFVDKECSSVGRLHTREITLSDIARLRAAGIGNISIDLIAGLPHQTAESWNFSLSETLATGVPHVSVYMLEVDEDSRLGSELLAGGSRYHAHFVPDDDLTADLYLTACERLEHGGVQQYEISNFARPVTHGIGLRDSRHNLKYWTRQPYIGFGVDAHSMLPATAELKARGIEAVRFATPDSLEAIRLRKMLPLARSSFWPRAASSTASGAGRIVFPRPASESRHLVFRASAAVWQRCCRNLCAHLCGACRSWIAAKYRRGRMLLIPQGRLLSNEVFARFLKTSSPRQYEPNQ